jgi:hypothetical protein
MTLENGQKQDSNMKVSSNSYPQRKKMFTKCCAPPFSHLGVSPDSQMLRSINLHIAAESGCTVLKRNHHILQNEKKPEQKPD